MCKVYLPLGFGELAEKLSFDVEDENSIRYAYTDQSTGICV